MNDLSKYQKIRDSIQTADLIEWKTDSILGKTIRHITKLSVNHTSIVASMVLEDDTEPRKFIFEADEHGFHPAYLSTRLERFKGSAYLVRFNPEYDAKRNAVANAFINLSGTPYDYRSLFRNAVRRVELNKTSLYCSEAATQAIKDAFDHATYIYKMVKTPLCDFKNGRYVFYGARPGELGQTPFYTETIKIL